MPAVTIYFLLQGLLQAQSDTTSLCVEVTLNKKMISALLPLHFADGNHRDVQWLIIATVERKTGNIFTKTPIEKTGNFW